MIHELTDYELGLIVEGRKRCKEKHPRYFNQLLDMHVEGLPPCRDCMEATRRKYGGGNINHMTQ